MVPDVPDEYNSFETMETDYTVTRSNIREQWSPLCVLHVLFHLVSYHLIILIIDCGSVSHYNNYPLFRLLTISWIRIFSIVLCSKKLKIIFFP